MARTDVMTDVPDDKVDEAVHAFELQGATVTKTRQPNGLWTITATYPMVAKPSKTAPARRKGTRKG